VGKDRISPHYSRRHAPDTVSALEKQNNFSRTAAMGAQRQ